MSEQLDLAVVVVAQAKEVYNASLRQADSLLQSAVARNSSELSSARAVQATFRTGITNVRLLPNMQDPATYYELTMLADTAPTAVLA